MNVAVVSETGIVAKDVIVIYRNASLEIPTRTITALVGVKGAGKSTLLKAIMGSVPAAKGEITVLGMPVKAELRQNIVAYIPQSEEVDWCFPVLAEDVEMMGCYGHRGFLRRAKPADQAAVTSALEWVNMSKFRHRQIGVLSGGQRKRVFSARAIAQQGKVILLDELFAFHKLDLMPPASSRSTLA